MPSNSKQPLADGLVYADPHIGGKWEKLDRTDDIIARMEWLTDVAIKDKLGYVINLGDTFHTNDPTPRQIARVIAYYQRLEQAGIRSITLEGNHDHRGRSEKGSAIEPLQEVGFQHAAFVANRYEIHVTNAEFQHQPYYFLALPHLTADELATQLPEMLAELDKLPEGVIGLCHLDLAGAEHGAEKFVLRHQPGPLPAELINHPKIAFWLAGHIHKPQELHNNRVVVVGSILQHDFGEFGEMKRFFLIAGSPPRFVNTLPTGGPQLRQINLDFTDNQQRVDMEQRYTWLCAPDYASLGINKGDIVKIQVRISDEEYVGTNFPRIEELLEQHGIVLGRRISPVIIRSREYRMRELQEDLSDEEIVERYVKARARKDQEQLIEMANTMIQGARTGA